MQQTMIRAQTKLEFAYGLASRMAEAINDGAPATAQMLGEIWTYAEFARAAIHAAEAGAAEWGNGLWFPDGGPLAALRAALPDVVPARERDHHVDRLAQPAGRPDAGAVRRSGAPAAHRPLPARARRASTPRAELASSASPGTSSARALSPVATSSTSASTWRRERAATRSRIRARRRSADGSWSIAF